MPVRVSWLNREFMIGPTGPTRSAELETDEDIQGRDHGHWDDEKYANGDLKCVRDYLPLNRAPCFLYNHVALLNLWVKKLHFQSVIKS